MCNLTKQKTAQSRKTLCSIFKMDYYYYRTYFSDKPNDDYKMHVTADGVSLQYRDGKVLRTAIVPKLIFPKKKKLKPSDISNIHKFIKYMDYKVSKLYDKKTFEKIQKQYKKTLKK